MKKIATILLAGTIFVTGLAGCSSQETELVTKTLFPEFSELDMEGNTITNDIFSEYDATVVNFWNNGCGTCIEEMPELEEMYQTLQEQNINLIGVGADSGESEEQLTTAQEILTEKGVTYINLSPDPENDFYKDFISELTGYPTTYIVDSDGNIVGAPIIGNVKNQEDTLKKRLESIIESQ
ncbi:MAG TPA: TlpA family protein disulfide reductase [Firmicutes bacterium]|nr:TlpA family protein disulfide reductase [Bacillota bacterium]